MNIYVELKNPTDPVDLRSERTLSAGLAQSAERYSSIFPFSSSQAPAGSSAEEERSFSSHLCTAFPAGVRRSPLRSTGEWKEQI